MEKSKTEDTCNRVQNNSYMDAKLKHDVLLLREIKFLKKQRSTGLMDLTRRTPYALKKGVSNKACKNKDTTCEKKNTSSSVEQFRNSDKTEMNKFATEELNDSLEILQRKKNILIREEIIKSAKNKLPAMATYYLGRLRILIRKLSTDTDLNNTFELGTKILSRMFENIKKDPNSFGNKFIMSNGLEFLVEILDYMKKYINENNPIIVSKLFEDCVFHLLKSIQILTDNKEGFEYFNKSRNALLIIADLANDQNLIITKYVFEILTKFCDSNYYSELIPFVFNFYYDCKNQPMPHFRLICILQRAIKESKTIVIEAIIDFINTIVNFYAFDFTASTQEIYNNVAIATYLNLQLISAGFLNICDQICMMKTPSIEKKVKYYYYKMLRFERELLGHAFSTRDSCREFNTIILDIISIILCKSPFKDVLHFSNIYGDSPLEKEHHHSWSDINYQENACCAMNVSKLLYATRDK